MPFIKISSSTGEVNFHYIISTPTCSNAEQIDPQLPVLLFFHSFAFHNIFHSQFCSPLLREFNLLVFDLRWHGDTKSDTIPSRYGQNEAAEDVIAFMNALQLPPCHFVAMDIGSLIALEICVTEPWRALSLIIMSHICLDEIPDVQRARTELCSLFTSGIPGAQEDCAIGYTQYFFSTNMTSLGKALYDSALVVNLRNWSPDHFREYWLSTHEIFVHRKAQTQAALTKISCPVKLLHGGNNIVYSTSYSEELLKAMQQAGIDVSLEVIPNAPHYMCVDYGEQINSVIYNFTTSQLKQTLYRPTDVVSPWDATLRECGWDPDRKNEFDDEWITISIPLN
ncbi:hypothetical protein GYMLUDRAFT_207316 [Collybiopsis luxurians FD-317 M1]|uniref:AB hydrolase-1 domain-containing protein n=1 Tax=Collybiopsis luxurians FD-317 M1 TaxID=944289 RepID=A0A0D0BVA2_9AGAR|nr:hypothetical protein GYMLUDRAFT_207316 [Collybiopsis luxurians FD-317 M1]